MKILHSVLPSGRGAQSMREDGSGVKTFADEKIAVEVA
jgi:hypothetical protein